MSLRVGWLAASSGRAPRPSWCPTCLPGQAVCGRWATVESEGQSLGGWHSLRPGLEPGSQEAHQPARGMVTVILPAMWAQWLFCGTSAQAKQFSCFVPCRKFG